MMFRLKISFEISNQGIFNMKIVYYSVGVQNRGFVNITDL